MSKQAVFVGTTGEPFFMRRLLRKVGLAEYGGDELLWALAACAALGVLLWRAAGVEYCWPAGLPMFFFLWFFRNPRRCPPEEPGVFVAPADGRVQDITEVDDPEFVGGKAWRVGIFLSPFDVHVNRAPCAGVVRGSVHRKGEFLPAYNPHAATRNESWTLCLEMDNGCKTAVKQISGVLARRIVCEPHSGDRLARGQCYGMIKFGSRTELYVPLSAECEITVKVGDKVRGGETLLARGRNGT